MSDKTATTRLVGIDALRGFAASWVVLTHAMGAFFAAAGGAYLWNVLTVPMRMGFTGVHLFLVLSGFCIHLPMAIRCRDGQTLRLAQKTYWKRRFFRLYPAYFAAMIFSVAFGLASGAWIAGDYSLAGLAARLGGMRGDFLSHALLTHTLSIRYSLGLSNGAFWSLALEAQLYLLYPLLLAMRNRMSLRRVIVYVLMVTLAWRSYTGLVWSGMDWSGASPNRVAMFLYMHAPARWFEWTLGFAAAELYARRIVLPAWCRSWTVCLVLFAGATAVHDTAAGAWAADPVWGVSFFVALHRVLYQEAAATARWWWRPMAAIGVFSYSLYLVNVPVLRGARLVAYNFELARPWTMLLQAAAMAGCFALAYVFYRLFEKPFLGGARRAATAGDRPVLQRIVPQLKRKAA